MFHRELLLLVAVTSASWAVDPPGTIASLANSLELREKLGIPIVIGNEARLATIKVAVLDFGFEGVDPKRSCLPAGFELIEHYDSDWVKKHRLGEPDFRKGFEPGNTHGRLMAQAVWAMAGQKPAGPKFYLLNANGPTLFKRAVRYAIEQKVHVILFSGHFEGGGNFDGNGNINLAVSEAVKAGIVWVNAAGNHHGRVYNGRVTTTTDGAVRFGNSGVSSALFFTNRLDENTLTVTLTWNDYQNDEDAGTTKDLNLFVDDANGTPIASSTLKQITRDRTTGDGESKNPRERVTIPNLAKGTYRIRVVDVSRNFTESDRLRILLMPSRSDPFPHPDTNRLMNPLVLTDATNAGELYPPADHPRVITVGEQSIESAMGPTSDRRVKPDVLFPPIPAKWSNGDVTGGTSYAAAYFAGIVVQKLADDPSSGSNEWMRWFAALRKNHLTQKGMSRANPEPVNWRSPQVEEWARLKTAR